MVFGPSSGSGGSEKWLNSGQISKVEKTGCADGESGVSFIDYMFSFKVVVRGKDGWLCSFHASGSILETDDAVEWMGNVTVACFILEVLGLQILCSVFPEAGFGAPGNI